MDVSQARVATSAGTSSDHAGAQRPHTPPQDPPPPAAEAPPAFEKAHSFEVIEGGRAADKAPEEAPEGAPGETPKKASEEPPKPAIKLGGGLHQLFELLRTGRTQLTRWMGTTAYHRSTRKQKKGSRFKKGSLVDRKAG